MSIVLTENYISMLEDNIMDKKLHDIKAKMDALGIVPRAKIELAKIQAIEAEHRICFPKDYVAFITQIGDGWERYKASLVCNICLPV